MKWFNQIISIVMGSSLGVFIGHSGYVYWDYKNHPGLYAMQSAPWYTSILLYGSFTAIILLAGFGLKAVIRKKR